MYVKREVEKKFEKIKTVYKVIGIVGARQAGKTTLLKKMLEKNKGFYVTLDDPDAKEMFDTDVKKFEKQYVEGKNIVGIDEVQYGKDAGRKIKYLADKGHVLWITSSSELLLSKNVISFLVGRISILRLFPFSLEEFLRANEIKVLTEKIKERVLWEHITYGGYPKVVLIKDVETKKIVLRDLAETMILKDVSRTFSIEDIENLERLVKYLSINIGNIISYETLSTALGISFLTLKKYLDALEKSYLIKRVYPFYTNKLKELSKRPKIYFIDTGLRNSILNNFSSDVSGELFENYVMCELLKSGIEIKYWRTKSKIEVDFVIERDGEVIPVEAKINEEKIGRNLQSFIKLYKPKKCLVIRYKGKEKVRKFNGCRVFFTDIFRAKDLLK